MRGKKCAKPANAKPSERPRAQAGPPSSGTDVEPVSLPMEVWQRVASYMSTRDVVKGLAQTCKRLWNMSHDAICLTSGSKEGLQWACKRWRSASKLCLHPSKDGERSTLMAWAAMHCNHMGTLTQLAILNDAINTAGRHSAASVAAMVAITGHHAANLQVLHLDMWDIPELPRMLNLKHLVLSMGNRPGTESNSSDLVWTCLQYLTGLETLDLALVSRVEDKARDVDLSSLKKLERLRLVNIMASKLNVRRDCSISIVQRGLASLNLGICKDKELRVLSANFSVPQNMVAWPVFLSNWLGLQKVDISVPAMGYLQRRMCLDAVAQIPVVRLRGEQGTMYITMPKVALWQYLWLEAPSIDCEFQDFIAFGQSLHGITLICGDFNGGVYGSDVLLSLSLAKHGLKKVSEYYDTQTRRKTLFVRRRTCKGVGQTVHDTCNCGACPVCLVAAGVMHDHSPGVKGDVRKLLSILSRNANALYSDPDAAHHYDAHAYGEYVEDDYIADEDEPGEYCAWDKCMEKRMQDPEFYLGYN